MAKSTQKDYEMTLRELSDTSDIKAFLKGLKNKKKKKKKKPGAEQGKKITQKDFIETKGRKAKAQAQLDIASEMKSMRDAAKKLKGNKKKKKKKSKPKVECGPTSCKVRY